MKVEIELLSAGPVAVGARAWGHRGRARLTAIVKASFRIVHDRPLELAAPAPIVEREVPRSDSPLASLRRSAETALFLRRPEILLDAAAFSAKGAQVEQMKVRIALARGTRMLASKELRILGDRTAIGEELPRPLPFNRMPIIYERAFGGLGHPENPAGVGSESGGRITMPNILGGEGARSEPFGYGAVSTSWPNRRAKRGQESRKDVDEGLWVELPDGFDDGYFQSAPIDQQVEDIAGGDLLAMVGLHPDHPTLRTTLPSLRGVAIAELADRRRLPIALRLDTLFLEPHLLRAELVFRGVVEVATADLQGVRVAGALEDPSAPFRFPELSSLRDSARKVTSAAPTVGAVPARSPRAADATMVLEPEAAPPAPRQAPAQPRAAFGGTMLLEPPSAPAPVIQTAPPPGPNATRIQKGQTLPMPPRKGDVAPEAAPTSMPFQKGKRRRSSMRMAAVGKEPQIPVIVPAHVLPASPGLTSTMVLEPEPPPRAPAFEPARAPFLEQPPVPSAPSIETEEVELDPSWAEPSSDPSRAAPKPAEAPRAPEPAAAPYAAAKPAEPPPAPKPAGSPWAATTSPIEPPKPKAEPAPRPIVQPAPDRKAQLYKKFKP